MNRTFIAMLGVAVAAVMLAQTHAFGQVSYELGDAGFEPVRQPEPSTPAGRLQVARGALADDRPSRAIGLLDEWIETYPYDPLMPEALLLRGDAKVANRQFYKSLFDFERLLRQYPNSPQFRVGLERELGVARAFAGGTKRKLLGLRVLPADGEAEELYIRIQERSPGSLIAETAGIELANFYYDRSQMYLASEMYSIFVENYPQSQWSRYAMQRRVGSYLAQYKGPQFDATGLLEADRYLEEFDRRDPGAAERFGKDELAVRIDDQLAAKDLAVARWYEQQGKLVSARFMYQRVIADYPNTAAALAAKKLLAGVGVRFTPAIEAGADTPTVTDPQSGVGGVERPPTGVDPELRDPANLPDNRTPGTESDQ